MSRIAIVGAAGRMGRTLVQAVHEAPDTELTVAIERPGSSLIGADAGELAGVGRLGVAVEADLAAATNRFDTLIDFTAPAATLGHVALCREQGKRLVIGTTGIS